MSNKYQLEGSSLKQVPEINEPMPNDNGYWDITGKHFMEDLYNQDCRIYERMKSECSPTPLPLSFVPPTWKQGGIYELDKDFELQHQIAIEFNGVLQWDNCSEKTYKQYPVHPYKRILAIPLPEKEEQGGKREDDSRIIPEEVINKIDEIASNRTYAIRNNEARRRMEAQYIRDILETGYLLALPEIEKFRRNVGRSGEDYLLEIDRHKKHIEYLKKQIQIK